MTMRLDPNALLRGGPQHFPVEQRIRHVTDLGDKVKIREGNRYEHFVPSEERCAHFGPQLLVFNWVGYTYVAE
jgi:hypothetical protein